jgi:chemotaxis protein MotB
MPLSWKGESDMNDNKSIIIKKVKKAAHKHHGGAWKIAYADFVTAMMAFFLLLWLISMTTPEQKAGLADYFSPPNILPTSSGSGGVMGGTALNKDGAKEAGTAADVRGGSADVSSTSEFASTQKDGQSQDQQEGGQHSANKASQDNIKSDYDQLFQSATASIRQAWQSMPDVTEMKDNLVIQKSEDGLDILLLNQQGRAMFPKGSKYPYDYTRQALAVIAPILNQLKVQIRISGHAPAGSHYTDPKYGPWELTSDRANVVRSILEEHGLSEDQIHSVTGRATAEPFFPDNPYMAANERIKITLLKNTPPVVPPGLNP